MNVGPGPLREAWDFVIWCAREDYRGPMPEHVRRAKDLLLKTAVSVPANHDDFGSSGVRK